MDSISKLTLRIKVRFLGLQEEISARAGREMQDSKVTAESDDTRMSSNPSRCTALYNLEPRWVN